MTITWSYSGQKTFSQCPKQYHEVKVLKRFRSKDSTATIYGKQVHEALEAYMKGEAAIPPAYAKFEPIASKVNELAGDRYIEHPMGITVDGRACDFDAPDVWWHGIPDVLIVNGDTAWVADWKTSKSAKYADPDQLELLALATFAMFPEVTKVKGALIFLVCDKVVKKTYRREQFNTILSKWLGNISLIEKAMELDKWHKRTSPLCGWCPVKDCEHAS